MKKSLLSLLLLILASCNNEDPFPRCISADDFTNSGLTISARVKEGSNKFQDDSGNSSDGFHPDQVIRWKDTGYVTTGEPIIIRTEGMWTSWLGIGNQSVSTSQSGGNDDFNNGAKYEAELGVSSVPKDRICGPYSKKDPGGSGCSNMRKCPYVEFGDPPDDPSKGQYGPPCWFNNGYGAYLLLKRPFDDDPNEKLEYMRYPKSPIIHIGYDPRSGETAFSTIDHPIIDTNCSIVTIEKGWKIYAKILDRFYWDNAGGYAINFVKGAKLADNREILENIRKEVITILIDEGAKKLFKKITGDNVYIDFVKALLVLYIAFTGIVYMFGMVQQPYSDVLIRIIKIAIIMQLISPYSWEFFYNNLAIIFVEGIAQLIMIINSHSGVEFNPDAPFAVFDRMLDIFFSGVVWGKKMRAFIWTYPPVLTCLVLLVIILIIISYVFVMVYACIIYLTSMIGIAVLISLIPILFLTLLFSKLPNTFENWLKQAMSFAFQSIMIFTLVSLFAALIMNFFYRTFGYTTCYNKTVHLEMCLLGNTGCFKIGEIWSWTFGEKFDYYEVGKLTQHDLGVKSRITFNRGAAVIKVPPEYKVDDYRYIDYPFLDPDPDSSVAPSKDGDGKGYDYNIIKNRITKDQFVIFEELFALVLITMLLWHLRLFVQRLGASIAGTSPFLSVVGHHYANFFSPISHSIAGKPGAIIAGLMRQATSSWGDAVSKVVDTPGRVVRSIPGVNKVAEGVKGIYNVAEWSVGAESNVKRHYREQDAFKWIHHKQAVIGQTLSDMAPDHVVKSALSYGYNKVTGKTSESFGGHIKKSYAQQLEKLHDNIIGYKRPGAPKHKEDASDESDPPFQRSETFDEGTPETEDGLQRTVDVSDEHSDVDDTALGSQIGSEIVEEFRQEGDERVISTGDSETSTASNQSSEMDSYSDRVQQAVEDLGLERIQSGTQGIEVQQAAEARSVGSEMDSITNAHSGLGVADRSEGTGGHQESSDQQSQTDFYTQQLAQALQQVEQVQPGLQQALRMLSNDQQFTPYAAKQLAQSIQQVEGVKRGMQQTCDNLRSGKIQLSVKESDAVVATEHVEVVLTQVEQAKRSVQQVLDGFDSGKNIQSSNPQFENSAYSEQVKQSLQQTLDSLNAQEEGLRQLSGNQSHEESRRNEQNSESKLKNEENTADSSSDNNYKAVLEQEQKRQQDQDQSLEQKNEKKKRKKKDDANAWESTLGDDDE
ncbi:MAG: type IV secretion system protein [Rickettsiaceae bacterium H1]|nr:type IV secretion system protein [Rickettsiaceae bacterium H1]